VARGRLPKEPSEETLAKEKILYSNCEGAEKPQMAIRFAPPGIPVDGVPILSTLLKVKHRNVKSFGH